jgi:tetraacyldisaccharide 4'-kinase
MMIFNDHHIFDIDDLKDIKKQFEKIEVENKLILTTEKDSVRLTKFENELKDLPIFVFPMKHKIMFGEEEKFSEIIHDFIKAFKK